MMRARIRLVTGLALAALGGVAWLAGGASLWGPLLSVALPVATAISVSRKWAFLSALIYYLIGSVSITGAMAGYYGGHWGWSLLAWIGASVALALPWTFAGTATGRLFALMVTAIPPLGVIGWLSPLNAAGVMFPTTGFGGLALAMAVLVWCDVIAPLAGLVLGIGIGIYSIVFHPAQWALPSPSGWAGIQTSIAAAHGDLVADLANKQALIGAARSQAKDAAVAVLPEAVLDDWLPGTRQQFSLAVPPDQTWLIGAQMYEAQGSDLVPAPKGKPFNAVVMVQPDHALSFPLTAAAGLLLGGNWRPWNAQGLQPAGAQHVFELDDQRVWAALCIEQLQPWTWMLAMFEQPTLVLAMNNAWWAPARSFAPRIQVASTRAWARLMNVPVIWASNRGFRS
ncbi:MAG: conjugal transfer protein TraB [Burkholderiaceae bacterium]|jgi:hypothetical protein|nr:conjugal transfer protein TraB [Burkholderiaceae bacterium]